MSPSRRAFLRAGAVATGAVAAGPLRALEALAEVAGQPTEGFAAEPGNAGYGWLRPAGPHLDLPEGFRYVRFAAVGDRMSNGKPTPDYHDGMAAFPGPGGTVRLVRNQEVEGRVGAFAKRPYDAVAGGGTVNLVFDPKAEKLVASHPSLCGTVRNCARGPTPWGTWITCEETTVGREQGYDRPVQRPSATYAITGPWGRGPL